MPRATVRQWEKGRRNKKNLLVCGAEDRLTRMNVDNEKRKNHPHMQFPFLLAIPTLLIITGPSRSYETSSPSEQHRVTDDVTERAPSDN